MGQATILARVHDMLNGLESESPVDEIVGLFPDLAWNEVFWAIDELSRAGQIRLRNDNGKFRVRPVHRRRLAQPCEHRRSIDDVRTPGGEKTGQLRCLECFAIVKNASAGTGEESARLVGEPLL